MRERRLGLLQALGVLEGVRSVILEAARHFRQKAIVILGRLFAKSDGKIVVPTSGVD